jgi:hypothetical protein
MQPTVLPLNYIRKLDDITDGNRIYDFWLGPNGDSIYHFHEPYPQEDHIGFSVGPSAYSYNMKLDDGFVFTFLVSNNPNWYLPVLAAESHAEEFPKNSAYR